MLDPNQSGSQLLAVPAGQLEVLLDLPTVPTVGLAVVAHPQPLLGGSAQHKVPQFLAKGLAEAGWLVVRPNFRGVGRSTGTHDHGAGESCDLLALCEHLRALRPELPLGLVGFSFGAFVQARVARQLLDVGLPPRRVFLAGMPFGEVEGGRLYNTPDGLRDTLVVHGESDERVPLKAVFDWARPTTHPITVVPGGDHFFTGRLHVLRALMLSHFAQQG